jgi:hypothetical protein
VLWLTSGVIDGGSIGGFVWLHMSAAQKIDSRCTELNAKQATVMLPIPLKLNMTRNAVEQLLGKPSGNFHETFTYLHEHKERLSTRRIRGRIPSTLFTERARAGPSCRLDNKLVRRCRDNA